MISRLYKSILQYPPLITRYHVIAHDTHVTDSDIYHQNIKRQIILRNITQVSDVCATDQSELEQLTNHSTVIIYDNLTPKCKIRALIARV